MLRSYLTIALRYLRREKVYAAVNLTGLAVGLACVLLVFLYVRHELSFDDFHERGDRIFRLVESGGYGEAEWRTYVEGDPVSAMRASFPDVEAAVKLYPFREQTLQFEGQVYPGVETIFTEPSFFDLFSFDLLEGDPATVLARPGTAVVTRSLADRLFKGEDAVGQVVPLNVLESEVAFEVTGVVADVPGNSHLSFDLLLSYETLRGTPLCLTCGQLMYALLAPGADPEAVAKRAFEHVRDVDGKVNVVDVRLEPLAEVYFSEVPSLRGGDRRYVYLLATIAGVMLLIACANYMNLATARSARRVREVGIRKTVGAHRGQIARQFVAEALLLVLLALPFALVLLAAALPFFNELAAAEVPLDWVSLGPLAAAGAALLVLVGLVGGAYPALYLSGFDPVAVLKGQFRGGFSAAALRRVLVILQFAAAVVLLVATIVVLRQLAYVRAQNLGFDADQVVILDLSVPELFPRGETIRQELLRIPGVVAATAGFAFPGQPGFAGRRFIDRPEGKDGPIVTLSTPSVDAYFLETMRVPLVAGRDIKEGPPPRGLMEGLANESMVRAYGWPSVEAALGKEIFTAVVVGVVPDFNFESLHNPVAPLLMVQNDSPGVRSIALRIRGDAVPAALDGIERAWKRLAPDVPLSFSFLRDELNQLYEREQRAGRVFGIFAGLAVLVACLGLFGLAAFSSEQRTKEVGIRKVLGASVGSVVFLLSKEFVLLVGAGFVLAFPVAYVAMGRWLDAFAYRAPMGPDVFAAAAVVAVAVAFAAVGLQAARAATADPVDSLRYE